VHDLNQGGGRILGEACHFVDLISYFTDSEVESVFMSALGKNPGQKTDIASIHLKYANGSLGVINYFSNGSKAYSKERVEVYSSGKTLVLDNFRKLEGFDTPGFSSLKGSLDKGHDSMFKAIVDQNEKGGQSVFSWNSLKNTHLACFAALKSLSGQSFIKLNEVETE
jgi:predicted dehydrogenase